MFCAIANYYEPKKFQYQVSDTDGLSNVKKAFNFFIDIGIPDYLDAEGIIKKIKK
jgi:hypothetical protein